MNNKSNVSVATLYVSILAFVSFAVYILYINQEVFYTAHQLSEFLIGTPFFDALMSRPFGLMQYAGAWLTQLFYSPFVGAGVLLAIWILTFLVGIKAFRLKSGGKALMLLPIACLLTSIVDLGYWVYLLPIRGYWFSQSVSYLIIMLLMWAARSTPRRWHLMWYVLAFCLYPILGWFALLFMLSLILSEKENWREIIGLVLLFSASVVWHALLYPQMKLEDVEMAGFPRLIIPTAESKHLSIPFYLLCAASLLNALYKSYLAKYLSNFIVPVVCAVAGIVFTFSFMYRDNNYIDEMRMIRSAEADNWKDVLDIYSDVKKPTLTMVMMKNIALMNEGGLLDRSFKLGNEGHPINNPDSLQVSFLEIGAPIAYYNYGMHNEGFRLNFECAEQTGFSPIYLKMMTRNAFANGETNLVERYKTMLHGHPYYRNWQPAPVTKNIQELSKSYPDELSGVENSYSYITNSICFWNHCDSKVASEQALFYAMMRCDSRQFWEMLRQYLKLHVGEEFPLHAQEAFIMFTDKSPEEKKLKIPVSQDVYNRYKRFWEDLENFVKSGINKNEIKKKMNAEYGDTYWYYNIFATKVI